MSPYEITVDAARSALWAKSQGFWDVATTHGYLSALTAAATRVGRNGARSWWLIDLSDSALQSRECTELLGAGLPRLFPANVVVAVVTPRTLHAMQAKRVVADDTHQYFTTVAAAETWLESQGRPT